MLFLQPLCVASFSFLASTHRPRYHSTPGSDTFFVSTTIFLFCFAFLLFPLFFFFLNPKTPPFFIHRFDFRNVYMSDWVACCLCLMLLYSIDAIDIPFTKFNICKNMLFSSYLFLCATLDYGIPLASNR